MLGPPSLALFVVPFTLAALVPGPAQMTMVARVVARGSRDPLPFVAGMVLGNACWLCLAAFGLSALAARFAPAFVAVKWLSVAYLGFMAYKFWSAPAEPPRGQGLEMPSGAGASKFFGGAALTLGNPKAVVFFSAVLPQAFDLKALRLPEVALVVALGLGIDLLVQGAYLFCADQARRVLRSARRIRFVNRVAASAMAGSAAFIASRD